MIRVLHFVSKMDWAGQETFIMNVYRNMNKQRYQFVFLCTDVSPGDFDDEITALGGKLFYLPVNPRTAGVGRYINEITLISEWLMEHKKEFDLVHLHTYHALDVFVHLMACRRAGCRKVVVHSHNTMGAHPLLHFFFRFLDGFFECTRYACSYEAGVWLFGAVKMKRGSIKVIYNGIAPGDYRYNEKTAEKKRRELKLEGRTVIGHVGRFSRQKNHIFILEVFQKYLQINPGAVLLLIGKGELQEEMKKKAGELEIRSNVLFMGAREDIPALLSVMDILLFPSLHEGLSVVLVEAQASGLKCVISAHILPEEENVIPELFTKMDLNENADQWAEALSSALSGSREVNRSEYCDRMIKSGFNIVKTAEQMEMEYEKIVREEKKQSVYSPFKSGGS